MLVIDRYKQLLFEYISYFFVNITICSQVMSVRLLRHCFAIPKLLCLLHTSPFWRVSELFNELIHTSLVLLHWFSLFFLLLLCTSPSWSRQNRLSPHRRTYVSVNTDQLIKASRKLAKGGLGIYSAIDLSLLSSLHSTSKLISSVLSPSGLTVEPFLLRKALNQWSAEYPMPPEDHRHLQHGWDYLFYKVNLSFLLDCASDHLLLVSS